MLCSLCDSKVQISIYRYIIINTLLIYTDCTYRPMHKKTEIKCIVRCIICRGWPVIWEAALLYEWWLQGPSAEWLPWYTTSHMACAVSHLGSPLSSPCLECKANTLALYWRSIALSTTDVCLREKKVSFSNKAWIDLNRSTVKHIFTFIFNCHVLLRCAHRGAYMHRYMQYANHVY